MSLYDEFHLCRSLSQLAEWKEHDVMGNDLVALVDLVWAEFSRFKGDYRVQLIITLRRPSDTQRNTGKCHEHISWPDDCFWWLIGGYFQLCLHIADHFLTQSQKACRLLFSNRELLHVTRCVNHDIWSPTCFIERNIWRFCWRLLLKMENEFYSEGLTVVWVSDRLLWHCGDRVLHAVWDVHAGDQRRRRVEDERRV